MQNLFVIQTRTNTFWSGTLLGLIEGVYDQYPDQAHSILRHPIQTLQKPTFLESEIVKVAAKRIRLTSDLLKDIDLQVATQLHRPTRSPDTVNHAQEQRHDKPLYEQDRLVDASLLNTEGVRIAYSKNTNAKIRTRHAEMNLIDQYGKKFPRGSQLIVSLKPCRMCAAAIWENAESIQDFRVIYRENDPGKLAQGTLLDENSPARLRAFGKNSPYLKIQVQEFKQNA